VKDVFKRFFFLVYTMIPFKKIIFFFFRKIWNPPQSIYQHLNFNGEFVVSIDNEKSFRIYNYGHLIENRIFWTGLRGSFEGRSLNLWIKLVKLSSCAIDVGSNNGLYSLTAKAVDPEVEVYAFEPVKRVYKKLVNNNNINNYGIFCINSALSDIDGVGNIYDTGEDHVYSATISNTTDGAGTLRKVSLTKLDSFVEDKNICVDLIKIDVEGHEPEVLMGFIKNLSKFRPTMLIEVLTDEAGIKIQEIIGNDEYLYFDINESGSVVQQKNIKKSSSYNYLICQKKIARKLRLI